MVIFFTLIAVSATAPQGADGISDLTNDKAILLKSRSFVPEQGIEASLRALPEGRYHVFLTLNEIPAESQKQGIENLGVKLLQYIPRKTYISSLHTSSLNNVISHPLVNAITPIPADDKISPYLRNGQHFSWALNKGRVKIYVQFFSDVYFEDAKNSVSIHGDITDEIPLIYTVQMEVTPGKILSIARLDSVAWIEQIPPPEIETLDQATAVTDVDVTQASPFNLDGSGIKIMQNEPGLPKPDHPDMDGRITINPDSCSLNAKHATQVAGVIIGDGWSNNTYAGVATGGEITSYCTTKGNVTAILINYGTAINSQSADLSSNSWVFTFNSSQCGLLGDYDLIAQTHDYIVKGLITGIHFPIVFAAGNDRNKGFCGTNPGNFNNYGVINRPNAAKNTIVVGATNSNDDSMTTFSGWGPVKDGRVKPDIVAPGCQAGGDDGITMPSNETLYVASCGTSFATPLVSGIIALIDGDWNILFGGFPEPATHKGLLAHTAIDLPPSGPDYQNGFGRVNASKAIRHLRLDKTCQDAIIEDSIASGGADEEYSINVMPGMSEIKATLVWDDPQAAVMASPALINNLDLRILDPDGLTYQPWVLDSSNPSFLALPGDDNLNNIEQIPVIDPIPGKWIVKVLDSGISQSPQKYSLMITCRATAETTDEDLNVRAAFLENEPVYGKGRDFPRNDDLSAKSVSLYVLNGSTELTNGLVLNDLTEEVENVTLFDGTLLENMIWSRPKIGYYRFIVDVDQDGIYNGDIDIVQNSSNEFGFRVYGLTAVDSIGNVKKMFDVNEDIYAEGTGFPLGDTTYPVTAYIVKYDPNIDWKNQYNLDLGAIVLSEVPGNPLTLGITENGTLPSQLLWSAPEVKDVLATGGRYNIIIDIDNDGIFSMGKDAIAINGIKPLADWVAINSVLQQGDQNYAVPHLKAFLNDMVGSSLDVSSDFFDALTTVTLQEYQDVKGIPEDGIVHAQDIQKMDNDGSISFRIKAVEAVDKFGNIKQSFQDSEDIYIHAVGLPENKYNQSGTQEGVTVYITKDKTWANGVGITNVNEDNNVGTSDENIDMKPDENGELKDEIIWHAPLDRDTVKNNRGKFDMVVDVDKVNDKVFNRDWDVEDKVEKDNQHTGFIIKHRAVMSLFEYGAWSVPETPVTKAALTAFVEQLGIGDAFGMLTFTDITDIHYPLQDFEYEIDKDNAKNELNSIFGTIGTDPFIEIGIAEGINQITSYCKILPDSSSDWCDRSMVLQTIGGGMTGAGFYDTSIYYNLVPRTITLLPELIAKKIALHTIFIDSGWEWDEGASQTLSMMSKSTGGHFMHVTGGLMNLFKAYLDLSTNLKGWETLGAEISTIVETGNFETYSISIDPSIDEAFFVLGWNNYKFDGNVWQTMPDTLSLILTMPNGTIIDKFVNDPKVVYSSYNLLRAYRISDITPGDWSVEVYGDYANGTNYLIDVIASTDLHLSTDTGNAQQEQNESLLIKTSVAKGSNNAGNQAAASFIKSSLFIQEATASVTQATALIINPDSSQLILTLNDNGLQGDEVAGDGIFSSNYNLTLQGNYEMQIDVNGIFMGEQFVRQKTSFIYVTNPNSLEGYIFTENGTPVENVLIYTICGNYSAAHAVSEANGYYKALGLSESICNITLVPPRTANVLPNTTTFTIIYGDNFLNFTLAEGGIIEGRVTDSLSAPIENVMVSITGPVNDSTVTDTNGTYYFRGLYTGWYNVSVIPTVAYTPASRTTFVLVGQTVVEDFQLGDGCWDDDSDGTYPYDPVKCLLGNDCDDSNPYILGARDNIFANHSLLICPGSYDVVDQWSWYAGAIRMGIIHVMASNITIDCQGATLNNVGSSLSGGIYAFNQHNFTVKNCNLQNFTYQFSMQNSSGNTIENLNFTGVGGDAIGFSYSDNNLFNSINILSGSVGVKTYRSDNNLFSNFTVTNQGNYGFYFDRSNNNTITDSTSSGNRYRGFWISHSNHTIIQNSNFSSNGDYGIYMEYSHNNIIDNVRIFNHTEITAVGIYMSFSDDNSINSSVIEQNSQGLRLFESENNNILINTFSSIGYDLLFFDNSNYNLITGNNFSGGGVYDLSILNNYCGSPHNNYSASATKPPGEDDCECTDADGDGSFAYSPIGCEYGNDCDDNNSFLIGLNDDIYLDHDVQICNGTYNLTDDNAQGIIILNAHNIDIDCNNVTLIGAEPIYQDETFVYGNGFDNLSIKNCNFDNLSYGVYLYFSEGHLIENITANAATQQGGTPVYLYGVDDSIIRNLEVRNISTALYINGDRNKISSINVKCDSCSGIKIIGDYNNLSDLGFFQKSYTFGEGISVSGNYNSISDTTTFNCSNGCISLQGSYNNFKDMYTAGSFYSSSAGFKLLNADYNNISNVTMQGDSYGMKLTFSEHNIIHSNFFNTSILDLRLISNSNTNKIYGNLFYGKGVQDDSGGNNYCQEPRNYYAPNASMPWAQSSCDCTDNDGDGSFVYSPGNCTMGNDCDDTNASIFGLKDDAYYVAFGDRENIIANDSIICPGAYNITDAYVGVYDGVIKFSNNNIILDCSGAEIRGDNYGYGILLNNNDGITVKNCTIAHYYAGINLENSHHNTFQNIGAFENRGAGDYGIYMSSSNNNSFTGFMSSSNIHGIYMTQSSSNSFSDGIVKHNSQGASLSFSDSNSFKNIEFDSNSAAGFVISYSDYNNITNSVIKNHSAGASGMGITMATTSTTRISGSEVSENDIGIRLYNTYNTQIVRNRIIENTDTGILIVNPGLDGPNYNISWNSISNNSVYNFQKTQFENIAIYLNWWGSDEPLEILSKISGQTTGFEPFLDYDPVSSVQLAKPECEINGLFGNCSQVGYDDTITRARVDCSSSEGDILNAQFNLINKEDNKIFFEQQTVNWDGFYWVLDNQDIFIQDSGTFRLTATCVDNHSTSASRSTTWLVPFGTLQATLVNPVANATVNKYSFFNFTTSVTCRYGECGNVSAILDPVGGDFLVWDLDIHYTVPNKSYNSCPDIKSSLETLGYTGDYTQNISGYNLENYATVWVCAGIEGASYTFNTNNKEALMIEDYIAGRGNLYLEYDWTDGWSQPGIWHNFAPGFDIEVIAGCPSWRQFTDVTGMSYEILEHMRLNYTLGKGGSVRGKLGSAADTILYRNVSGCYDFLGVSNMKDGHKTIGMSIEFGNLSNREWPGTKQEMIRRFMDFFNVSNHQFPKGAVPENSGEPFYTISYNPRLPEHQPCYANMNHGDSCQSTWIVNATGPVNKMFEFYTIYHGLNYNVTNETGHVTITINGTDEPLNNNPILYPIAGLWTVNEMQALIIDLDGTDADNDSITYHTNAAEILLSGFSFDSSTGLFSWTPTFDDGTDPSYHYKSYYVSFSVTDSILWDGQTIKIMVYDNRYQPILSPIGNKVIGVNETLLIDADATDADNNTLIYYTNATFGSFNTATGLFSWTPGVADLGVYSVKFRVTDGEYWDEEAIAITVAYAADNYAPVISNVTLESTSSYNLTGDNLTVGYTAFDKDNDTVIGIINWYKGGIGMASLNMPFEAHSGNASLTAKDYSGHGYNGVVGGAVWNATGGFDGRGAYYFANKYITMGDAMEISDNFTVSLWFRQNQLFNYQVIMGKWNENSNNRAWAIASYGNGKIYFYISSTGANYDSLASNMYFTTNRWYHLVATFKNGEMRLYVDGSLDSSKVSALTNLYTGGTASLDIGRSLLWAGSYRYFVGSVDEVRIYNKILSPEQIRALYQGKTGLIVSQETGLGDVWKACVTGSDGKTDGTAACSSDLSIIELSNYPPVMAAIGNRAVNETRTLIIDVDATDADFDPLTYYTNATFGSFNALTGLFNWTPTLDDEGIYHVKFNVTDGGLWDRETITITVRNVTPNRPPVVESVILDSTDAINGNLTVYYTASDPDNDSVKGIISWHKDSSSLAAFNSPFEGGSNATFTRDYSAGNNGTVIGAAWNRAAGQDSFGAYYFGGDDYISFGDKTAFEFGSGNFTISLWMKAPLNSAYSALIQKFSTKTGWILQPTNTNNIRFQGYSGGTQPFVEVADPGAYPANSWTHYAVVRAGNNFALYRNGAAVATASATGTINDGANEMWIGRQNYQTRYFVGFIDDVLIYRRALSPEQVRVLAQGKTDLIVSKETGDGELWQACVTPNDGTKDGLEECSNELVIGEALLQEFNLTLTRGWNLISLPLNISNKTIKKVFENVDYNNVYSYEHNSYILLNNNSEIRLNKGYWINANNDYNLTVDGLIITNLTYNLNSGYNLISYPSINENKTNDTFYGIKGDIINILTYDNKNKKWQSYNYNKNNNLNTITIVKPGNAYFINLNKNISWGFDGRFT